VGKEWTTVEPDSEYTCKLVRVSGGTSAPGAGEGGERMDNGSTVEPDSEYKLVRVSGGTSAPGAGEGGERMDKYGGAKQ